MHTLPSGEGATPAPSASSNLTIPLGHTVKSGASWLASSPRVFYDAPELALHRGRPWLLAYLKARHGLELDSEEGQDSVRIGAPLAVPAELLAHHTVICGASGSGKTRLALHLLREQLRQGCSAVVLDFKSETIRQALACAKGAGLSAEQVTVVWPGEDGYGIPGWNPFVGDPASVRQAVREFVAIVEASATSWGPRLQDVLTNAATVVAGQRLSLLELTRFLQSDAYRDGLLATARQTPAYKAFREEHAYFETEFAFLGRGERAAAVAPVLNKIRSLVATPYLRALLCADKDTLDLPGLWQRPRLLAVHLDTWALGADGTRLLAGMLTQSLFNTAKRKSGQVPVVLCLDEAGMQERFTGGAIKDILAMARSLHLRMLAACQHLDQLSDSLRTALLSSTALNAFFRLGPDDARRVAASLATGSGNRVARVSLSVTKSKYSPPEMEVVRHTVTDPQNRPLSVAPLAWEEFCRVQASTQSSEREEPRLLKALSVLMQLSWIPRAYVKIPGSDTTQELTQYVRGLSGNALTFTGPAPLQLAVRFPRPKVTILEQQGEEERTRDLAKALMALPIQEVVIRTARGLTVRIKVADIPFPSHLPEVAPYLAQGQSAAEMEATEESRRAAMERLACPPEPEGEAETTDEGATGVRAASPTPMAEKTPAPPRPKPAASARKAGKPPVPQAMEGSSLPARIVSEEPEVADDGSL